MLYNLHDDFSSRDFSLVLRLLIGRIICEFQSKYGSLLKHCSWCSWWFSFWWNKTLKNTMQISNQELKVFKLWGTTSDVGNTSCSGCYGPATTPHRLSPKCPREAAGSCWRLILHICQSFRNIEKCFEKQRCSRLRRISKPSVFLA